MASSFGMSKILPEKKDFEVPLETSKLILFGQLNTPKECDFRYQKSAHNMHILKNINHSDTKSACGSCILKEIINQTCTKPAYTQTNQ